MNADAEYPPPNTLQFYWYEIKPAEDLGATRGQLNGAIRRLVDIEEQIALVQRQRDFAQRLCRATVIVEAYLHRAYELRERAVGLLGAVTGHRTLAEKCKKPSERTRCMQTLRSTHPTVADSVHRLLDELDKDVDLRNIHTHKQLLSIGLWARGGPFDVHDLLMESETWPIERQNQLMATLRSAFRQLVAQYRRRIRSVINAADEVIDAFDLSCPET